MKYPAVPRGAAAHSLGIAGLYYSILGQHLLERIKPFEVIYFLKLHTVSFRSIPFKNKIYLFKTTSILLWKQFRQHNQDSIKMAMLSLVFHGNLTRLHETQFEKH